MPAVLRDPTLPTLYLDWSHLSRACMSMVDSSSTWADWADLATLLQAGTANVCVSFIHLLELLAWPDPAPAARVADAMDRLRIVWMESGTDLDTAEAKRALLHALGTDVEPYRPFLRGFLALFSAAVSPSKTPEMLANPNVATFFAQTKGHGGAQALLDQSLANARELLLDRLRAADEGIADEELRQMVVAAWPYKVDHVLRRAHKALRAEDGYRTRRQTPPSEVELSQAIRHVMLNPPSIRAFWVTDTVNNAFAIQIRGQDPGGRRFTQHQSAWFDALHCGAGGAFCDIFTCDARTAQNLGSVRTKLGFANAITERDAGGPAGVVRAIEQQLVARKGGVP